MLIGVAINLTSALWLLTRTLQSDDISKPLKAFASLCLAGWLVVLGASLLHEERHLPAYFAYRRDLAEVQARHVRDYLASGDASHLAGAPNVDIPYPNAKRLAALLDTPELRAVLPPMLLSRDAPSNRVEAFKRGLLANGYVWVGSGVLLLVVTVALRIRRRSSP